MRRNESSAKYQGLAHTLEESQACSGGRKIKTLKALWFCGCFLRAGENLELSSSGFWGLSLSGIQSSPGPSSLGKGTLGSTASLMSSWGLEVGAEKQEKKWGRVMRTPLPARRKAPATTKEAV